MRIVVQRVSRAGVRIENKLHSSIGRGLLVLLGIESDDAVEDVVYLVQKLSSLRIFSDEAGKMNLDIHQVNGEILLVSQFTLHASVKKGNRPSYIKSARPEKAIPLYELFTAMISGALSNPCKTGVFGADMQVELVNDGPVTILMDSKNKE